MTLILHRNVPSFFGYLYAGIVKMGDPNSKYLQSRFFYNSNVQIYDSQYICTIQPNIH